MDDHQSPEVFDSTRCPQVHMNRTTWNSSRALIFARGLYHIASCDGLDDREEAAIRAFCEQVGIANIEVLAAEPFDYAEAARVLDSSWLRRTLIKAARLMVQMDGVVSDLERDALRSMASALGIGERAALADLDADAADPSTLVEWIAALTIDHVSWDDIAQSAYFWAFPHPTHPLQAEAELIVNPSQALVCRHAGAVCDVLGPGDHHANPTTLPGLAAKRSWTGGPVEADLLYVRTGPTPRLRWGTATAISVAIKGRGVVPIRAFGRFTTRFSDPAEICKRFLRQGIPTDDDVEQRLRRIITGRFAQALSALPEVSIAELNNLDTLCAHVREHMDGPLRASGLHLSRFDIENLTGPLDLGLRPMSKRTQNMSKIARQVVHTRPGGLAPTEELIACQKCTLHIPANARFCSSCGTPNRKNCGECGATLPLAARFCSGCGTAQT